MKICRRCKTYKAMPVADKSQPSKYCPIAPQSDSDVLDRWVFAHPFEETDYCYYCQKVVDGQIKEGYEYSFAYATKEQPRWAIGVSAVQEPSTPDLDDRRTFHDDSQYNRPAHGHL